MRDDIRPGAMFPDYELPDHTGILQRLSTLQGADPMVLVLSRGSYCPKDRVQHLDLVQLWPAFSVAYTSLVTIATDPCETLKVWREELGDPMIPYTFVLLPGLRIHTVYNGYWYWGRPTKGELHRDLREASRQLRSDWDITVPALRDDWHNNRRLHYPYEDAAVRS